MTSGDGTDAANPRDGGIEFEAIHVSELAELKTVKKDEICVTFREGNICGIERIRESNIEAGM